MRVTKYCDPVSFEYMMNGQFKLGALEEYRTYDASRGTHTDRLEGMATTEITGDIINANFTTPTGVFSGINILNSTKSIVFENTINANVFCSTIGDYSYRRHKSFMFGNNSYRGNPESTCFIVLDKATLLNALRETSSRVGALGVMHGKISYGSRIRNGQQRDLSRMASTLPQHDLKVIFTKPVNFQIEHEYRFAIGGHRAEFETSAIYTRIFPDLSSLFVDSIVDSNPGPRP